MQKNAKRLPALRPWAVLFRADKSFRYPRPRKKSPDSVWRGGGAGFASYPEEYERNAALALNSYFSCRVELHITTSTTAVVLASSRPSPLLCLNTNLVPHSGCVRVSSCQTIKSIKNDVTRHRYGDEAHLDTTVKFLGLVLPQSDYPQLEYITQVGGVLFLRRCFSRLVFVVCFRRRKGGEGTMVLLKL